METCFLMDFIRIMTGKAKRDIHGVKRVLEKGKLTEIEIEKINEKLTLAEARIDALFLALN
mgnify:CR=1 FL=1